MSNQLVVPSGFDVSSKTPVFAVGVEFATNANAFAGSKKILLLGNGLSTGTVAVEVPTKVYSLSDAQTKFGAKSELAQMCDAVFAQNRNANVWCVRVAENGAGVQATGTILFATTATSAGVVRLWFQDRPMMEVVVASGDTPATIGAAVTAAFNRNTGWPATASGTTTVTLTAAQKGTKGNQLLVRAEITATGTTMAFNGGSAGATFDGALGTGTATAGAGADSITNALAAIAASKYDLIVSASADSTNAGLLKTHINARATISERIRQQGVIAPRSAIATSKTLTDGLQAVLLRAGWHYASEEPEATVAAAVAAAMAYGDGQVANGGKSTGEFADCAANLNGTMIAYCHVQHIEADRPTPTEVEDALANGLTVLQPCAGNPGFVQLSRSVTTRYEDSAGNPNYDTIDTGIPTALFELADRIELLFATQFPNKKLRPDPTNLSGPTRPDIVFPYMLKRALLELLYEMEGEGKLINVAALASQVQVEQSTVTPTLVVCQVPASVIPILNAGAVRLIQASQFFLTAVAA